MPEALHIVDSLRGERLFVTGATGFLGKALVEKLLWSVPEVAKLRLLIRPTADRTSDERLTTEILGSPLMARLRARHGEGWHDFVSGKVEVVAGDLAEDRFGLDETAYAQLCDGLDRVVASAATVTFDERLDRALELNTRGALRTLQLARDAGDVPLLHVSTCFVSGERTGRVGEELPTIVRQDGEPFELEETLAELDEVCRALAGDGDDGAPDDDAPWVTAGQTQAARLGFHDVYTLTKALGEHLVARHRGAIPVAILRPAIVESMVGSAIPGWVEDVRVSDPLLVAYGKGRTREIPGAADVPLELVPVDHVVHALLAALANLPPAGSGNSPEIYQVGSSRHPITLGELMAYAREGFAQTPLRDDQGEPISVPEAHFVEPAALGRQIEGQQRKLRRLAGLAKAVGAGRRGRRLTQSARLLDHFLHLIEVYRPYLSEGASYRDDATRRLWDRLSTEEQTVFPFDITSIDWRHYIARCHVPGLIRFALQADTGAPPPSRPAPPQGARQAEAEAHAAGAHNLFDLFRRVARAHGDQPALQICRRGRWLRYTYAQALTTTCNMAQRLATEYGIGRGDRVVLWSTGCPEWVLTTLAAHRLGAVVVPLDPQWPVPELVEAARLVEARLIAAAPALHSALVDAEAVPGCPVVSLAEPFVPSPDVPLLDDARALAEAPSPATPEDLATILFTSGTTVAPKAVPLSHGNYLTNVRDLVPLMKLSRERLLSVLPIHHVFEQMVGLLVPLTGASTLSYVAEIKPAEINWMMATTRPTVLVAVPRLLELLHAGIFRSIAAGGPMLGLLFKVLFALSRLSGARHGHRLFAKVHRKFGGGLRRIATGGSALRPSLGRSFQLMGFQVAEGYGMTETSPCLTVNPWGEIRLGSAGRPLSGVEIELREPEEAVGVAPGAGEIWVRGGNVMSGYFENPEATDAVLRDGWLNTGDIGHFDDDYLYLSGRSKDVIVTAAGKNVYPEEVELRYRGVPDVEELIVLGLPTPGNGDHPGSAATGERVVALVVPRSDASDREIDGIRAAIAERSPAIPSYQRVTQVEIWRGDLPKTTTMKVKRGLLRDAVLAGERGNGAKPPPAATPEVPLDAGESWVVDTLARLTHRRPDELGADDRLADLGVDSLSHVELIAALESQFGQRLDDATVASLHHVRDLFALTRPAQP